MVVLAAAIFAERGLALYPGLGYFSFCHFGHLVWRKLQTALSQENKRRTSTKRDSNTHSIRVEKEPNRYTAKRMMMIENDRCRASWNIHESAFMTGALRPPRRLEPPGQFVAKIVAGHETFSRF